MLRDASVWGYSETSNKSKSATVPLAPKSDWPTTIDLPEATSEVLAPVPVSARPVEQSSGLVKAPQDKETPKAPAQPSPVVSENKGMAALSGNVGWTHVGGGSWVLKADGGKEYLLKGDDSILRLRVGDKVEVSGVVKPSGTLGMASVVVEKVSFSAKR